MRKRLEGMEEVELTFMWHAEECPVYGEEPCV